MSKRYGVAFERAKEEYYKDNKICLGVKLIPNLRCYGHMSIHHAKGKEGDLLIDKRYFRMLCRSHHDWVHVNEEQAIELGLSFIKFKPMTKQQLVDAICATTVTNPDHQVEYFKRGFLRQVEWNPNGYIWNIEKFQYRDETEIQEIYETVKGN